MNRHDSLIAVSFPDLSSCILELSPRSFFVKRPDRAPDLRADRGHNVTHVYKSSGTYTIMLTIQFLGGGSRTTSQQVTITSTATATATAGSGLTGLAVGGAVDKVILALADGSFGGLSAPSDPAVRPDIATDILTGGAGEDRVYVDLAGDLLLGPQPGPAVVNISDEASTARAKGLSHS
jgi:hypothetical protein